MNQHTPGPWYETTKGENNYQSAIAQEATGKTVALTYTSNDADARLIAAAPQLLAALKSLVLSTDGIVSGPESDLCACCGKDYIDEQIRREEAGEDCIYECTDPDCPRVQAMQAIAQATGEQVPR